MPNSLGFRLFISFALWTFLVLPATAFFLIASYRSEIESGFDYRLNQYLIYLIDRTFPESGLEVKEANLGEPLFSLPFSGLYWQIKPLSSSDAPLIKSESLVTEKLTLPSELGVSPDARLIRAAYADGPDRQRLRVVEREISLSVGAEQRAFSYAVAGDIIDVEDAIYDFTTTLIINLTILGLGIIATTFLQVRYGLWPLRDIGARLAAIRSGEAERLEGKLPQEILPLQDELNALIQSNNHIIERARTHVGNLAHALKTPLSVILNEARGDGSPAAQKIAEQAALMREHIDHYLNRARLAARSGVVGNVTPVAPVLASLSKALARINEDRGVTISVDCPADLRFKGEKQDLEEMAGNLLDNACKWAQGKIRVQVVEQGGAGRFAPRSLILTFDDDGPGMTDEQRAALIKRGTRYDETKPGSGLGLSIVADLADLYQGKFTLEAAPSGGLRARLTLPAA